MGEALLAGTSRFSRQLQTPFDIIIAWLGCEGREVALLPATAPQPASDFQLQPLFLYVQARVLPSQNGGSLARGLAVCWRMGLQTPVDCEGDDAHLSISQLQYW